MPGSSRSWLVLGASAATLVGAPGRARGRRRADNDRAATSADRTALADATRAASPAGPGYGAQPRSAREQRDAAGGRRLTLA